MLPPIVQDVDQRVSHFGRRPQDARMVSIPPYAASPSEDAVDSLGDPDGEPAHTALEGRRRLRLYQQVQMIFLNAELEDPESWCARRPQGDLDRCEEAGASQAGQPGGRPQRHVGRTPTVVRDASTVRDAAAPWCGLSSGAAPATAPGSQGEFELFRSPHLNWQISIISVRYGQGFAAGATLRMGRRPSAMCRQLAGTRHPHAHYVAEGGDGAAL